MTLRQRVERLEGPTPPPVDEAAVDAEIKQLVGEICARDGITVDALLAKMDAEVQAAAERP